MINKEDGLNSESQVEKPTTADLLKLVYEPAAGMNRKQRRSVKKQMRFARTLGRLDPKQFKTLNNVEEIVDDEREIEVLQKDLSDYNNAQAFTKNRLMYHNIWMICGLSEQTARNFLIPSTNLESVQMRAMSEANTSKLKANMPMIINLQNIIHRSKIYEDEEEREIVKHLSIGGATVKEIFREIIRARQASIELIEMQIDYLKEKEMEEKKKKKVDLELARMIEEEKTKKLEGVEDVVVQELPAAVAEIEPVKPPLADWQIYWTSRFWSDNPNHLARIDTQDRDATVVQIENTAGHEASIGSKSVLRALEFHLHDRDKIQRALATRNKYAPEEIRRWVKVKRGKDRIGILIDEQKPQTAIFFVGGRDIVYRGL